MMRFGEKYKFDPDKLDGPIAKRIKAPKP